MIIAYAAAVWSASLSATVSASYSQAHKMSTTQGCPMLVVVSASWCPACRRLEQQVLPEVRRRGLLKRVAFAVVDLDRQPKLAQKLIQGGPIPQLIMYRKTSKGWLRRRLIGCRSVETVATFIDEGLRLDRQTSEALQTSSTAEPKSGDSS